MKKRCANLFSTILVLSAALAVAACTTLPTAQEPAAGGIDRLKPLIESLKLDTVALEEQYRLLRATAADYAFRSDEQLNYVQKTALFVQSALEGARHQWEVLSIVDYVKTEAVGDYCTLRAQGLKTAYAELAVNITLVDLYGTLLKAEVPRSDAAEALKVLQVIRQDYEQLLSAVEPLANVPQTALLE